MMMKTKKKTKSQLNLKEYLKEYADEKLQRALAQLPEREPGWEKHKVDFLHDGSRGDAQLRSIELDETIALASRVKAAVGVMEGKAFESYRFADEGHYKNLLINGALFMSDTYAEISEHFELLREARGRVLISGLGLGVALKMCIESERVEHTTVVELSTDVCELIVPQFIERYGEERFTILNADARHPERFVKAAHFDYAWHDIWETISGENLPEMLDMQRRWLPYCTQQAFWSHERMLGRREQLLKEERATEVLEF